MNTPANKAMEWLSRTIAILVVMLAPGLLGGFLDDQFDTRFLAPAGLIVGMSVSMYLLLLLAKKLTPPARGEPIPFDDEIEDNDRQWPED